ncbi:MAG: TetR family transcriptional regulator, partial [Galactobacter sp.]
MGRPSVGPQRRAQILDATVECISEFGIVATTLERIAEKAGMSR